MGDTKPAVSVLGLAVSSATCPAAFSWQEVCDAEQPGGGWSWQRRVRPSARSLTQPASSTKQHESLPQGK